MIIGNRKTAPFLHQDKVQEANSWRVKLRAPQNIGLNVVRRTCEYTCGNRAPARENERVRCLLGYESKGLALFCGGIVRKRFPGKFSHLSADSIPVNTKRDCNSSVFTSMPNITVIRLSPSYIGLPRKRETSFRTYMLHIYIINWISINSRDLNIDRDT